MIEENVFIIKGKKNIIFRREKMFTENEEWVTFDPEALEYYTLNTSGAEFFYIIYKNLSIEESYKLFY